MRSANRRTAVRFLKLTRRLSCSSAGHASRSTVCFMKTPLPAEEVRSCHDESAPDSTTQARCGRSVTGANVAAAATVPRRIGREDVGSASGPAYTVLR